MPEVKSYTDVYDYITTEETNYKTRPVPVADGWDFHMYEHIRRAFMMKNSKFWKGNNDGKRPFKNIVRPILNFSYRSEGFDVKDIVPYVNDEKNYYKSFLVKKYHPRWARKNDIDTFIDDLVECSVDYDLVIAKRVGQAAEIVPLQRIAFCDQTDVDSGPFCERHQFSVDMLLDMKGTWYDDKIDESILMAQPKKDVGTGKQEAKTPGKYIEIYELHGSFPETWLNKEGEDEEYTDETKYVNQIHIVTYYVNQQNKKTGVCLFKAKEKKKIYKSLVIQKIFGRAVGFGMIESLFEPQVWTNYSEIQLKEMLDAASLMLQQTADDTFETKNNLSALKKNSIVVHKEGMPLQPVDTRPINIELFNNAVARWQEAARTTGSANDAALGKVPADGTPFKLQELVVNEGEGIHDYRKGKISTFLAELYRDWFLPSFVDDLNQGNKWVEELSLDEMQFVAEKVAINEVNKSLIAAIENGDDVSSATADVVAETAKNAFMQGGNKRFLEIVKGEISDTPVDVEMNIAGKQKDLSKMTDKLTNIFRQIISNPQGFMQIMQIPGMAKTFNEILEGAGLSQADFSGITSQMAKMAAQASAAPAVQPGAGAVKSPIQSQDLAVK